MYSRFITFYIKSAIRKLLFVIFNISNHVSKFKFPNKYKKNCTVKQFFKTISKWCADYDNGSFENNKLHVIKKIILFFIFWP